MITTSRYMDSMSFTSVLEIRVSWALRAHMYRSPYIRNSVLTFERCRHWATRNRYPCPRFTPNIFQSIMS